MKRPQLELRLILGPNDPPLTSAMCQEALRAFVGAVSAAGFDVSATSRLLESADALGGGGLSGRFIIDLVTNKNLWLVLGPIITAWLTRRNGRKIRVKVGDIEVEAHTPEDVEKLLTKAQEIQDRNRPKVIHER